MGSPRTLVVAVDNSTASEKALEWTLDTVYKEGDELWLVHVVPIPVPQGVPLVLDMAMPVFPNDPDPKEDMRHVADATDFIQRRFGEKLEAKNIPYKAQIAHFAGDNDSVGEALCKRAEALQASMMIMNKHQRGLVSQFLLGSAAKYAAVHCRVPLVVLHF